MPIELPLTYRNIISNPVFFAALVLGSGRPASGEYL